MNLSVPAKRRLIVLILILLVFSIPTPPAVAASVTLAWDSLSVAPEGYRVFARKANATYDYSQPVWDGTAVTCMIDNLDEQTEYYFVARAYDGSMESADSNEAHYIPPESDDTQSPTEESEADVTPPSWNGATTGIGLVNTNGTDGSATVEFDTAIDLVDGSDLRFNVYYAPSSSWNNAEWNSNSAVADATVGAGSTFTHAVRVSGLDDDIDYVFGVRVEDQSGNEDTNNHTMTAIPTRNENEDSIGNLALNQPTSVSSAEGAGLEEFRAVDRSLNTRWSSEFFDDEWITVDLGSVRTIGRVILDWETAYGAQYEIQVSTDGAVWTTVFTERCGNGGTDDIVIAAAPARYVRMQGVQRGTQWGYSLFGFEIYDAASSPESGLTSIAEGRPVTVSSAEGAGLEGFRAVDGSLNTRWSSKFFDDEWITVDLGSVHTIGRVVLNWETAYAAQYAIQVSDDAVYWTTIYTEYSGNGGIDDIKFTATDARYVRMKGIKRGTPWGYSLWEFEVYGAASNPDQK